MACNSALAHDSYAKLIRPQASQREVVRAAGIATWIVGGIAMIFALNPPDFLIVLYTAAVGLLASSFFAPMILGIWWPRCTTRGATAGLFAGAVTFAAAFLLFDMPYSTELLVALPVSFVTSVGVSLAARPRGEREKDRLEPRAQPV